jgi:hypothetical protein
VGPAGGGGGGGWNVVTIRRIEVCCLEITQILCYKTINLVC